MGESYAFKADTKQGAYDKATCFVRGCVESHNRRASIVGIVQNDNSEWCCVVDVCGQAQRLIRKLAQTIASG